MTITNQTARKLTDPATLDELRRAHENSPLISIQDVSKKYGVSIRTLRRWQAEGLKPEQIKNKGKSFKYLKRKVELCISHNKRLSKSQGP